ncbi:hypothetical protein QZH41_012226 [Actinostola sp. cb2023]|nr:hypothetical protein QZH41_012226 [Actinostola sp. cb2023]
MTEIVSSKERVVEAISFLNEQDAQARKSKANLKTSLAVETIEGFARREGLSGELIIKLIDLACCGKYNESVGSKIVKSVIPQDLVPSLAVLKAVSWICTNTLSSNFQAILLRWIIVVYKLIDDLSDLQSCYGMLFLFLESDILCPHACLLLSNLTKQEDVKHFRIKKLLNLQNRVGSQAHLNGLLAVYKMFCPHLVSMATSLNAVWFKNRDESWCEAVARVQANRNSKIPPERLFLHARDPSASRNLCCDHKIIIHCVLCKLPSQIGSVLESPFSPTRVVLQSKPCIFTKTKFLVCINHYHQELNSFADLLINIDRIERRRTNRRGGTLQRRRKRAGRGGIITPRGGGTCLTRRRKKGRRVRRQRRGERNEGGEEERRREEEEEEEEERRRKEEEEEEEMEEKEEEMEEEEEEMEEEEEEMQEDEEEMQEKEEEMEGGEGGREEERRRELEERGGEIDGGGGRDGRGGGRDGRGGGRDGRGGGRDGRGGGRDGRGGGRGGGRDGRGGGRDGEEEEELEEEK